MLKTPSRLLCVVAAAALLVGCRGEGPPYDNLVFVTVDTLRADHLGLYGYPRPTSPYLDELGREGVVFWHAVAASSHTAPSHATMLTSLYPEQHRVLENGHALDPGIPSLAGLLQAQGIETVGFVSVRFLAGLSPGFDILDAQVADGEVFRTANLTVDRAIEWLRTRDRTRRFALWVHVYDPHQHVVTTRMPEPWYRLMREDSARRGGELLYFVRQEQGYPRDGLSGSFNRYDAQIAFVDDQIRRLFEAAAEVSPASRTLRVVTADHGEGLGNHNFEGHGRNLYQEQVRVPLILHGDTERLRHGVITSLVRHVDLLPTFGELLGVTASPSELGLEGVSLVPLLRDPSADLGIEPAFSQRRPPDERRVSIGWEPGIKLAVQDGRFKYIRNPEPPHELYDLQSDPYELRNLIRRHHPEKERLERWLLDKYEKLSGDHRAESPTDEIDPEILEDLKALGYI
ncbi:MAG: sulfatase [Acidobacteria bacterium]|jgi:arylsulfatase A-like enzyme|nr:sulfatase [Acidobacteriota bacterium]